MKNANHGAIDGAQLKTFVERTESLEEEIAALNADKAEVYKEAKSAGYDPKYIRKLVQLRKLDPDELDEADELLKMYREALGL